GARPRRRVEVTAGRDHSRLGGSVARKQDELVVRLPFSVPLANADDQAAVGEDTPVRIPQRVRGLWLGRDGLRLGSGSLNAIEAGGVGGRAVGAGDAHENSDRTPTSY